MLDAQMDIDSLDRRDEDRLTTMLPVLEVDGTRRVLHDFSNSGFRCQVPERYRREGAEGEATVEIQAAGYRVTRRIAFTVRHVSDCSVGASFRVLSETSEAAGTLF
ncbi:MAG: hypothetical protein RKK11_14050 [Alphaproteobacteria bacterium]